MGAKRMAELKPCPFCGGEAKVYGANWFWAYCRNCKFSSRTFITPKEAVEAWNRRAIVHCKDCLFHGECMTEDAFHWSDIRDPFCAAGKLKESDNHD